MLEILISIFFGYRNALLAKQKGQNTVVWVLISIIAFFLLYIFVQVTMILLMHGLPKDPYEVRDFILAHPMLYVTSLFGGIGGFLLVRYILEKMPDANSKNDR